MTVVDTAALSVAPTVVCFHHAGGGASAFGNWERSGVLDIHAVQLPGRETRRGEERFTDLGALVELLADELKETTSGPHVFFGHSMGALVAHALTSRAVRAGTRLPEALVVAASAPPHIPTLPLPLDSLTDLEIAQALAEFDGIPAALLERPEWLGPLLATVKDDIRVCQSSRITAITPLPVPVHAIAGTVDRLVSVGSIGEWERHTDAAFSLSTIAGGHFLTTDHSAELEALVERIVRIEIGSVNAR